MEDNRSYDLVILGGGAAAFAAITEASGRGLSTAIVNTGLPIGGTCVNVGCVPSKHLLAVGESAAAPQKNPFEAVQYSDDEPTVDWDEALDGTDALVERFRQENYVDVAEHFETDIYGATANWSTTRPSDRRRPRQRVSGLPARKRWSRLEVHPGYCPSTGSTASITTRAKPSSRNVISPVASLSSVAGTSPLSGARSSIASASTTILQRSERVLSGMEGQLGREMQRAFEEEGIKVITGNDFQRVRAPAVDGGADAIQSDVGIETLVDGNERTVTGDALFVATGVQPNSEDIGLETVGVEANDDGAILVDEHFQTANPDVYAAGDVIGEPELETVAAKGATTLSKRLR